MLRGAEAYSGAGADWLYDVVVFEEMARAGATGPGFMIHTDLVATYLSSFGSEGQKSTWLPKMVSGEVIGSLGGLWGLSRIIPDSSANSFTRSPPRARPRVGF